MTKVTGTIHRIGLLPVGEDVVHTFTLEEPMTGRRRRGPTTYACVFMARGVVRGNIQKLGLQMSLVKENDLVTVTLEPDIELKLGEIDYFTRLPVTRIEFVSENPSDD